MTAASPDPNIEIAINTTVLLQVDEIWPDGDAPDPVTSEEVRRVLEHDGPKPKVLRTWGLLDDAIVTVKVTSPDKADQHHTIEAWAPAHNAVPATGGD